MGCQRKRNTVLDKKSITILILNRVKKMSAPVNKVVFANQLRGIAVLAVLIVHWCAMYWYSRDPISAYIYAPVIGGEASTLIYWIMPPTFNYGPFGVAIFFLVSGFVIPFSLQKANPLEFLVSRVFRIYPTYWVASALMLGVVWLSAQYWGRTFEMDHFRLIANLTLINVNFLQQSIDMVNWTLSIELKFYLVAAILYQFIRKGSVAPLIMFACMVLVFCWLYPESESIIQRGGYYFSMASIKTELMCVVFMFIGTGFYYKHMGVIGYFKFSPARL